jgi:hypothetical protein
MMVWRRWNSRIGARKRAIITEFKTNGLNGVLRSYGWKLLLAVFVFYLIRDTFLYIILPLIAGRAIWQSLTG